jgi:hypothetical protein
LKIKEKYFWLWEYWSDEGYSRNVSCTLLYIYVLLLFFNSRSQCKSTICITSTYMIHMKHINFIMDNSFKAGSLLRFFPYSQGSPNQAKWATFSPWFQWNCPISVKKRSFSLPVSLFKSVFFSPIIILFLQYSRKRSSHVPEIWPIQGLMFNILFQTR